MGKLTPELLARYVLSRIGLRDPSVIVGPALGEDAAIVDIGGGKILVAHVDPITEAVENIGWLAVHIASNDIAVRGARPRWLLPVLYLPENSGLDLVDRITAQIDEAAREVGAMVIGGHSEFTPRLERPLISMTALGITEVGRYVTTSGARVGDAVVMTKTVAVEGTAVLSTDFREVLLGLGLSEDVLVRAEKFLKEISVVKEAIALAEAGLATSMHDPTEGGLLGGLVEIAYASNKTIEIWEDKVPIAEETAAITRALGIDPLKLISSGVLVATVPNTKVGNALKILEDLGVRATVIGRVTEFTGHYVSIHRRSGVVEILKEAYVKDEISAVWERWASKKQ